MNIISQAGIDIESARQDVLEDIKQLQQELNELQSIVYDDNKLVKYIINEEIQALEGKKSKKAQEELKQLKLVLEKLQ